MPEPTSSTAGVVTLAALVPGAAALAAIGGALGLRGDVLFAGFAGGLAGLAFLNTVPSTGDTWREMLRTSGRRVFVIIASAFTAGYCAPLLLFFAAAPDGLLLKSFAFAVGAGAGKILPALIDNLPLSRRPPATPPEQRP
jgi:hypothetical protein